MNSKYMFGLALMMGAMLSAGAGDYPGQAYHEIESEEDKKKRLANAKIAQNKSKGLKKFDYHKGSVWALNQKSADKKAKKLNLI